MSRGSDRLSGTCVIGFEARGTILLAMISGVNRRQKHIKLIRVKVEGFTCKRRCGFVL